MLFLKWGQYIKDSLPPELKSFWQEGYPNMQTIEGNIALIDQCGYRLVDQFQLPNTDWQRYHHPLQKRLAQLKINGSVELNEYIKSEKKRYPYIINIQIVMGMFFI